MCAHDNPRAAPAAVQDRGTVANIPECSIIEASLPIVRLRRKMIATDDPAAADLNQRRNGWNDKSVTGVAPETAVGISRCTPSMLNEKVFGKTFSSS